MILLDTDHLTVLKYRESQRYERLNHRMSTAVGEVFGTTIVNVEEVMRGWLAVIAKERHIERQISAYRELSQLFFFFQMLHLADLTEVAAQHCQVLRQRGVKVGTMDLKIASIAITTNSLLLSANKKDFQKVSGLRFESWID